MSSPSPVRPWRTASPNVSLAAGEVHIWRIPLELQPTTLPALELLLAPDEVARARRFVHERDRKHFIAARGSLRQILARYLETAPERVDFLYGDHGKPYLKDQPLHFNLSHSGELAVVALTLEAAVGVDVEKVRPFGNAQVVAQRFFTERESSILRSQGDDDVDAVFFHLWTCKEAYLKATGKGLAKPLREVEVSLPPEPDARFLEIGGSREELDRWSLKTFVPWEGYLAAWVVEGSAERVSFLEHESGMVHPRSAHE